MSKIRASTQVNASGAPSSSTYLRGDDTWASGPGGTALDSCHAYASGTYTPGSGSVYVYSLDSESWDTNNMHDPVTNPSRITIKQAGKYIVIGQAVHWANGGQVQTRIHKNGTAFAITTALGSTVGLNLQCVVPMQLAVNDYLELASFSANNDGTVTGGAANVYLSVMQTA